MPTQGRRDHEIHAQESELAQALHRLAVASAAVDSALAQRLGVSSTDYVAIKHVMAAETAIGPVDLGRLLGMTSGSATALVDRLQRSGHLERTPHPHDRRRLVLTATAPAVEQILAGLEPLAVEIAELGSDFTSSERRVIGRFLDLVAERYIRHSD